MVPAGERSIFGHHSRMKRLHRTALPTLVAALYAATLAPVPASAAALAGVAPAASAAKRATNIPVLVPTGLPNDIVGGGVIWAALANASASGYEIAISQRKGCTSPGCRFGFIRGGRHTSGAIDGRPVRFAGTNAYFTPSVCSNTCTPATLTWTNHGGRYVLGLRGASLSALESTARTVQRF
jgi:hypothetical protein